MVAEEEVEGSSAALVDAARRMLADDLALSGSALEAREKVLGRLASEWALLPLSDDLFSTLRNPLPPPTLVGGGS